MILYQSRGIHMLFNTCMLRGSVFPTAFFIAVPACTICGLLKWSVNRGYLESLDGLGENDTILSESAAWSGFSFLVGFLVIFRTSISYSRFWDGVSSVHTLQAEWFDACSAAVAFCRSSKANKEAVDKFQQSLVCFCSLMHALALSEIEDSSTKQSEDLLALRFDVIKVGMIDPASLLALRESNSKVQLVFLWIQELLVENIETGVLNIPPPLLSRVFQQLGNGMVALHEAVKVSSIPFPFPYAQACDTLLMLHWAITPIMAHQWVESPWWAMLFTFVQVFILWVLNLTATELQNPFGSDPNDLEEKEMQTEMNSHLSLLLKEHHVPTLSGGTVTTTEKPQSLMESWLALEACQSTAHRRGSGGLLMPNTKSAAQRKKRYKRSSSQRDMTGATSVGVGSIRLGAIPLKLNSFHSAGQPQRRDVDTSQTLAGCSAASAPASDWGPKGALRPPGQWGLDGPMDQVGHPTDPSASPCPGGQGADNEAINGWVASTSSSSTSYPSRFGL